MNDDMPQLPAIFTLDRVTAGIRTTELLHDISWTVRPGEHWVITGRMGAGKTTLARLLTGQARVFSGRIRYPFLGEQPGFDARRQAIRMVSFSDTSKLFHSVNNDHYYQQRYQAFDSDGHLTVRQYLEYGGFDASNPQHQAVIRHTALEPLLDLERIKLSSGQTRKMLIAKAVISEPQVLILDNPYIGLDAPSRRIFNDYLDELAAEKEMTIILSGHYRQLPSCITHRLHLEGGRVVEQGALPAAGEEPAGWEATFADIAVPASWLEHFRQTPANGLNSIIDLRRVSVQYGGKIILDNLSWRVRSGEKWALLGNNGSGKSTILSLIYADHPQAYARDITLFDRRRGSGETIWEIKKRIGFTSPELHAYFEYNLKAQDIVLTGWWDGFLLQRRPTEAQLRLVHDLFCYFELEALLLRPFHSLSTGQQRLLFFMRALIKAPELLLLDEPFQGLDAPAIERCRRLLDEILHTQHALVFITHYRSEIPSIVDQVLELNG